MPTVAIKICGVTRVADAAMCVDAGADAIGVNFVASSPRRVDAARAREIARAVAGRAVVIAVVADLDVAAMRALRAATGIAWLQLHGDETPETLSAVLPDAYKALRIGDATDVARAGAFGGEHLLVDAKVKGALGGTGATFDWRLARGLATWRKITLAGGLTPKNVAAAVREVDPFRVDVASGVEAPGAPGMKDEARVRAFIAAARGAKSG